MVSPQKKSWCRTFVAKVPTVTGMGPPEPGILVSVVTFEAMQLRGVSKVATLGFGLSPKLNTHHHTTGRGEGIKH